MVQKNTCLHKKRSTRFLWQNPFVLFEKRRSLLSYKALAFFISSIPNHMAHQFGWVVFLLRRSDKLAVG
jgi:hypothetical protein